MTTDLHVVPARRGRAVRLAKGQAIQIINTHGQQVVDTWCFNADDLSEFMSMEHLHATLQGIFPAMGDGLTTNRRRPILILEKDTSPGRHDTVIAACDVHRYAARSTMTIAPTTCEPRWGSLICGRRSVRPL